MFFSMRERREAKKNASVSFYESTKTLVSGLVSKND